MHPAAAVLPPLAEAAASPAAVSAAGRDKDCLFTRTLQNIDFKFYIALLFCYCNQAQIKADPCAIGLHDFPVKGQGGTGGVFFHNGMLAGLMKSSV